MNDRDHQIKQTSLDDENQRLKSKHKEDLKDHELMTNRDIQRLKDAHLSAEQTLKEQITKLESIRTSLERVERLLFSLDLNCFVFFLMKEINSLKSTVSTQKLNYEETFQHEKVRIKNEEEKKQKEIEDRLRTVISSKEELEVKKILS
jgi:hypothetical protein